jgi:hypothetical protein
MSRSPVLPRRAVLTGSLAALAGTAQEAGQALASTAEHPPLSDAVREALALSWRAHWAIEAELAAEGLPSYAAACAEAERLEIELEHLRARIAAKSPKTWEDVAVLAVIAVYWDRGEFDRIEQEAAERDEDSLLLGAGDRALPSLYLAVIEVIGIDPHVFAPS